MKYLIKMSDRKKDKYIEITIEENNVFDAITKASKHIPNPKETELIEAIPLLEKEV